MTATALTAGAGPHPLRGLRAVAGQEILILLRTRWVGGFGLLFLLLVSAFAWLGTADIGVAGAADFSRTAVGLVNLVCAVVPLMSLLAGVNAFSLEDGAEHLLFSQPVGRAAIVLGRGVGISIALSISILIGFGAAGSIISFRVGTDGIGAFLAFTALTLVLETAFVSIGIFLGTMVRGRVRGIGAALAVWVLLVLLYDLAVIGATLVLRGPALERILLLLAFLNPVDLFRVSALFLLGGETFFGPAGAAWVRSLGGHAGLSVLLAAFQALWVILPAALGLRALRRRDL